jgi:hypothetical protein
MPRQRTVDIVFAGLAFAVLYGLLRSAGQTPDGLSYALAARTGIDLYHPHHLLYGPVTRFVYLLTGSPDAILAGVLHNLAWLVVLAFGAWRLALGLGRSHVMALLTAVALLSCRGVMFYSTHVETYLPALACLAMFAAAWFRPQSLAAAAAWLALAVLYHQTNVLLVLPLLLASNTRRRDFLRVVLPAGAAVVAFYVAGWRLGGSGLAFVPWLLTYLQADVPAWGSSTHFSWGGWQALSLSQMQMILPVPGKAAVLAAVLLPVLLFALAWHHLPRVERRRERRFALAWLAVYLPFFLWWIPADPDFFLATLLPLWLLVLLWLGDRRVQPTWRHWALPVAALLAGNLWFTVRPLSRDPGELHLLARQVDAAVDRETTLVVGYGLQQELLAFTPRAAVFEGDGLGVRLAAGGAALPPTTAVLVQADYLRLQLTRATAADENLLRSLLAYEADGPTCRTYTVVPGAVGLLISGERQPAAPWAELWAGLRAQGRD